MKRLLILLCLGILPQVAHGQQAVSIESLMSASFPEQLTAAPEGGRVAWVQNDLGARNIWVARPPEYIGSQLTSYHGDNGQAISSLTWSPDGNWIVYIRGGGPNRAGETPNPTSDPGGASRAMWKISVFGGEPVHLGSGGNPVFSPSGEILAFTRGGQIWTVPADGSAAPTVLVNARGGLSQLRFSPDGSRLAFRSSRGDHAFIGVFDFASESIVWLDPSVDTDGNPVWSPEGGRIALIRQPADTELKLFQAVRTAQPWSIRVAEAATGRSVELWRAEPGRGSAFRGIVANSQLFWAEDDRIVFPWEADGWTHLYTVPAGGGRAGLPTSPREALLLTPGPFEVEHVVMTPDRQSLVFSSNQGDIDRRHLWRVGAAGGSPAPITDGAGIEWEPAVTSDGDAVAFFRSDAVRPAEAVILTGSDIRLLAPGSIPGDFPSASLVEPEAVEFSAADGLLIRGQLFRPVGIRPGERRPALLFFHGGSRRQMLLGWHYRGYYHNAYAMNQHLASLGFIVLSVNYRSGIGYGLEFREAQNYGAGGGSEFNDVMGAGLYLQNRPDVDPERIGLWGGSYGGYLTAMGLSRASDLFKAGVDFHGVHDWNVGISTFVPGYDPLEDPAAARTAFEASPVASLDTWRSPVLVISGDDDRNVSFAETVTLVEALRERDVEVEQLVFPDEVHGFLLHRNWLAAYNATAEFFRRRLGQ